MNQFAPSYLTLTLIARSAFIRSAWQALRQVALCRWGSHDDTLVLRHLLKRYFLNRAFIVIYRSNSKSIGNLRWITQSRSNEAFDYSVKKWSVLFAHQMFVRRFERTETNLMHFKWEVTWTHGTGTEPNTFLKRQRVVTSLKNYRHACFEEFGRPCSPYQFDFEHVFDRGSKIAIKLLFHWWLTRH